MTTKQGAATIEVVVEQAGPATIARVVGDAGFANVEELSRQLMKVAVLRPSILVFDMSKMNFICSLSIGAFMELYRSVQSHGGQVRFAGLTGPVQTVFERAKLHHLFGFYKSTDEALGLS